ncbi:MAG TPA: hypothetical protein VGC36_10680, partial [Rhizomicrobium sp.]
MQHADESRAGWAGRVAPTRAARRLRPAASGLVGAALLCVAGLIAAAPAVGQTQTQTATQTATSTRTATVTRTRTPTSTTQALLIVGHVPLMPGDQGTIPVTLDPGAQSVFYARLDVQTEVLSAVHFRLVGNVPVCAVNPEIGAVTVAFSCVETSAGGCRRVRAILTRQQPALPAGLLYSCQVEVDAGASLGSYPLDAMTVEVHDAVGQNVPAGAADG